MTAHSLNPLKHLNRRIALVWAAFSAILLATFWTRLVHGQFPDPDDALRMVQLRDLLGGQGWFDLTQYRINPPDGTAMHWSRLVDIPLALAILALSPIIGQSAAETAASVLVPLLTLGCILFAVGRLAGKLFDVRIAGFACLACGLLVPLVVQLQPMRIDHHGWQIAALALSLWALSWSNAAKGAAVAGLAMAAGASISLELLPMVAAFAAILGLRWLRDRHQRWWLVAYMQSFALSLAALYLATRGIADLKQYCDAISPAHLGFFLIAALGTGGIAFLPVPRVGLVVLFAALGGGAFAFFASTAPSCLDTPFAALDPLVRDFWYVNVLEGQPLWKQELTQALPSFLQFSVALAVTLFLAAKANDGRGWWWFEYALLLASAILLSLLVWRSAAFAAVIAAIPLGWLASRLLMRLRVADDLRGKLTVALAIMLLLMPAAPIILFNKFLPVPQNGRVITVAESGCTLRQSAALLNGLPRGTVFAPLDIGPSILLKSHHGVVATGHHRAQMAMHDVIAAFTSGESEARAIMAEHGADYVVMCTDLAEPKAFIAGHPNGLAAQLLADQAPEWLSPVDVGGPEPFRVWKIRN